MDRPTMNKTSSEFVLPSWLRPWEQFWFSKADPSLLGLIRIACGMIAVYTFVIYSFSLQDFMGTDAWHDMKLRDVTRYQRPISAGPLVGWNPAGNLPEPVNQWQRDYRRLYKIWWNEDPPPPYPAENDFAMDKFLTEYRARFGVDLRSFGAPLPEDDAQKEYAIKFTDRWKVPPRTFPKNDEEARAIEEHMMLFEQEPISVYSSGTPVFSLWFHVIEPGQMAVIHTLVIIVSILFMLGFCTRITTALTWFGLLTYIHRNPSVLFGVDTMMLIVLLYLMIGPAGATFSLDAIIRRWWRKAKPGVVQAWYRFWKRPVPAASAIAPAGDDAAPSVSANVAIRLLQIHVCIIYLFAGISKLQGQAWWTGQAIWMTLGNYEFAPMQFETYLAILRFLGGQRWLFDLVMTGGGIFTLTFEIGYVFCIWRPRLRWVFLGGAIILHGLIGLCMGLKTFSLMMLVMNMAFLRKEEAMWFFTWFLPGTSSAAAPMSKAVDKPVLPTPASGAITASS